MDQNATPTVNPPRTTSNVAVCKCGGVAAFASMINACTAAMKQRVMDPNQNARRNK